MPPKKKESTSSDYDTTRFVSAQAFHRYENDISKRGLLAERGFDLQMTYQTPESVRNIERKGWNKLCSQPQPARIEMVREFYANAGEHVQHKTKVRGKTVAFDSTTINKFYGLSENDDQYSEIAQQPDYEEILRVLGTQGPDRGWTYVKNEISHFPSKMLSREAKAWNYFITAKLMPVSHHSDVYRDRAILLYAISENKTINIGKVICNSICRSLSKGSLVCPMLITALCMKAGVRAKPTDNKLEPLLEISESFIYNRLKESDDRPQGTATGTNHARATSSKPRSTAERLNVIEQTLNEHIRESRAYQQYQMQWMHLCAGKLGVDMTQLPPPPSFPPDAAPNNDNED